MKKEFGEFVDIPDVSDVSEVIAQANYLIGRMLTRLQAEMMKSGGKVWLDNVQPVLRFDPDNPNRLVATMDVCDGPCPHVFWDQEMNRHKFSELVPT